MSTAPATIGALDVPAGPWGSPRARALMAAFHERHLPLTPSLAGHLAAFEAVMAPARDPFWGRGYLRAAEALGLKGGFGQGAIWRRAAPVFLLQVVEPILRRAAQATGQLPLWVMYPGPLGLSQHTGATEAIEGFADRALADRAVMGEGFWQLSGLALHAAATAPRKASRAPVPEIDAGVARLVFGLEPAFAEADRRALRRLKPRTPARRRAGLRPREGGVAGVLRSTRPDDLAEAVSSELILPEEMVALRLLDEGLIVRHRPPRREPRKDLLLLTLCDRRTEGEAMRLTKAVWIDLVLRLGLFLNLLGYPDSDLIWAEQGPFWKRRSQSTPAAFPAAPGIDPMAVSGGLRRGLLMRSGLFPGAVDATGGLGPAPEGGEALLAALARWAVSAPDSPAPRADGSARPAAYRQRAAIVVLDAANPDMHSVVEDGEAATEAIRAALLQSFQGAPVRLAVLTVPPALMRGAVFAFRADAPGPGGGGAQPSAEIAVPDADDPRTALAGVLGGLSGALLRWTLETLDAA